MNKILFKTLILIVTFFSLTFLVKDNVSASAMDTLFGAKKCNYVDNKLYQPFSGIDDSFPGAKGLVNGGCINVSGGTEGILKTAYTIAISLIILLAVINIAVSGIQYMTEEAAGQIKGAAKKRLTNSIIALGLALLSYTILYTINKQLVEFTFNPTNLTKNTSQLTKNTTSNISIIQGPKAPPKAPEGPNVIIIDLNSNPNSALTPSNFSTYASYGSIKCFGNICTAAKPTVFGYKDGDGRVGNTGDNGIGNALWSSIPGCTYDTGNTRTMGVALPQGFWRAAGIPFSDVRWVGVKIIINGQSRTVLPVVDDSQSNLDFTFAAAKSLIDPTITNSNRLNTAGKQVSFQIIKDFYKTNPKTNIVWTSNKSTLTNKIPCNRI